MKFESPFAGEKYYKVGQVESVTGRVEVYLMVHSDGFAHVTLSATDPSDRRKAGVMTFLSGDEYQKLWKLHQKTDDAIAEAKASGQMKGLSTR